MRFHETGGPEVLRIEDVDPGAPGPGEVLLQIAAIGINRAEALFRKGGCIKRWTGWSRWIRSSRPIGTWSRTNSSGRSW